MAEKKECAFFAKLRKFFSQTTFLSDLSLINTLLITIIIYVIAIIATTIWRTSFSTALARFFLILVLCPLYTLVAMTMKRIITTLWGSFKAGLLIFAFIGSFFMFLASFVESGGIFSLFILFFLISGTALFIIYEGQITFNTSSSIFDEGAKGIINQISNVVTKMRGIISREVKKWLPIIKKNIGSPDSIIKKIVSHKRSLKTASLSALGIIIILAGVRLFFLLFCIQVESVSPTGEVPLRAAIMVKFSDEITLPAQDLEQVVTDAPKKNLGKSETQFVKSGVNLIASQPSLKGTYRIEDGNTLIFVPDNELNPATDYAISINTDRLIGKKRFILGKTFKLNTPHLKVSGTNVFYNYDFINNVEKEVICEINFNHPIEIKELVKHTSVEIDGETIKFNVEPSNIPTRFYIKSNNIKRAKNYEQKVHIIISKGLQCIGGSIPLEDKFSRKISIPATAKLEVASVDTFPVEGNTYIAILFNRPVSDSMAKQYITIMSPDDKPVAFTVDTEYCYAVLKADFQPNLNYKVHIKGGMPSKTGEELAKSFSQLVFIKDLRPEVKFSSEGKILPLRGNLDIELYTLNLDSFEVNIEKIYRNNLVHFIRHRNSSEYGKMILSKTAKVEGGKINQKIKHYINLNKLHNMEYKGLFNIRLSNQNDRYNYDQQYVLCTDLGITAKQSGPDLMVSVYSIMDLAPQAGVKLTMMSMENQVIREGYTNERGEYLFNDWKINKHKFVPLAIIAEQGDDFSFIDFHSTEIDASRFDVGGEALTSEGMKAFLTPERGVYRPGEKAFITAIVRKNNLEAAPQVNVQLYITDPMDSKYFLASKKLPQGGLLTFEVPIHLYAKTGEYGVMLRLNEQVVLGRTTLKVEDFIPDKIKAEIKIPPALPEPGKPVLFTVKGTQLFGPPAAGRKVVTRVKLVSRIFQHPKFPGYTFNDEQAKYTGDSFDLGEAKLDARGEKAYTVDVPAVISPPSALTMKVNAEIYDIGGRPVSAVKNIPVNHYSAYLGIKVAQQNVYLIQQPVTVYCVAINPNGDYLNAKDAKVVIKRKVYYSILRKKGLFGEKYKSESYEEVLDQRDLPIKNTAVYNFIPKNPGEYTIYVYLVNGMKTSKKFFVQGPGMYSPNLEKAESLTISLNKEKYSPGEMAQATIYSPIPGRLFFTVEREKVFETHTQMLVDNKATIQFALRQEHVPNIYISAFVVRPPHESMKELPMTSLGIKNVTLDPGQRKMNLTIQCPEQTRAQRGLAVRLKAAPGSPVVISAVDEGVLQITQFKTPDPFEFFYKKRALITKLFSLFDAVLPNIRATKLAIGGDEGEYDLSRRHINPIVSRRVQSVALFSGVLYADANGTADYFFKIPEFNGKLRVMAIGAQGQSFGSTAKYVTVVDPIVLSPVLPRMLAPGDAFEIPVQIYNQTGKDGKCVITVSAQGPVKMKESSNTFFVSNQSEKIIYFNCQALRDSGVAKFTFTASLGNETSSNMIELAVRPTRTIKTTVKNGVLQPGKSVSYLIPKDYLPTGQRVRFSVSPNYLAQFLGAVDYLVQYPYGCSEQLTSQLFVLMYYRDLYRVTGYFSAKGGNIDRYINDGIKQLEAMQLPNGEFSMWPGQVQSSPYISDYIAHFLIEAKRRGFEVDEKLMKKVHEYIGLLRPVSKGRLDRREDYSWEQVGIYHLYLKALAGKADMEIMQSVKQNKLKSLGDAEKCFLASAFAVAGDKETARKILPSETKVKYFSRVLGQDYDSVIKRMSLYLFAFCHADPNNIRRLAIAEDIAKQATNGGFGTTHDSAWALIALSKAFESEREKPIKAVLYLDKVLLKNVAGETAMVDIRRAAGKDVMLSNQGEHNMYFNLMIEGIPSSDTAEPANNGVEVIRKYFNADNSELNLSNVAQGQIVLTKLTLKPKREKLDNMVIVDLLPSGLEVDNVRLKSRGNIQSGSTEGWVPVYEDIRDDRLILFTGPLSDTVTYTYTLRAVSVGRFVVPQAFAEAMYDPSVNSIGKKQDIVNVVRSGN